MKRDRDKDTSPKTAGFSDAKERFWTSRTLCVWILFVPIPERCKYFNRTDPHVDFQAGFKRSEHTHDHEGAITQRVVFWLAQRLWEHAMIHRLLKDLRHKIKRIHDQGDTISDLKSGNTLAFVCLSNIAHFLQFHELVSRLNIQISKGENVKTARLQNSRSTNLCESRIQDLDHLTH
jgi:hypothetical protein